MNVSARDHSSTRRPIRAAQLLVVGLIAVVGLGPIASSRHELTVRHVLCAEHGELMHIRTGAAAADPTRATSRTSVEGDVEDVADGHDHCSNGLLVRGRMFVSVIRSSMRFVPPPAVTREARAVAVSLGRAFVLASAPKTSPPATV